MGLNERIAERATKLGDAGLSAKVIDSAKWRILDIVGQMFGCARHADTTNSGRVAARTFPKAHARSVLCPDECSIAGAAFVNDMSALVLEFDDRRSDEISRTRPRPISMPDRFRPRSLHPTGMFGTFGVICAVSGCLRFDPANTANAVGIGGLLMALALCGEVIGNIPAMAQDYPTRPVNLIVPYAAGGTADGIARMISKHLGTSLGRTITIDNRGGAGGLIGAAVLTHSPADGYTIGVLATPHAATPLDRGSGFDRSGVTAVALVAVVPGLLCVNSSVPASSLSDVISLARAKPGQLAYGNPGNFTAGHLAMEMLKAQWGVDIVPVPYRGGAPALQDLLAGQIQMSISGSSNFLQYIKNGQLRAIAWTSLKRSTAVPDVPTFAESGMSGFELNEWYGIFAPSKTPPELVARLNNDVAQALGQPDVRAFFATIGAEPQNMSADESDAFFRMETDRLAKLVGTLGLKNE